MKFWKLIFAAFCLATGATSHAAVINYDEAVDGDLPNFNDTPASFLLDTVGENVWYGSSTTPTATSGYELDNFRINLGVGLQIVGYQLGITNITELPDSSPGAIFAFTRITSQDLITRYATLQVGDSQLATNPISLPWNDPLTVRTSYSRGSDTYFSWDWEVRLTTARIEGQVPVPAPLALMGLGLVVIGFTRKLKV